MAVLVTLLGGAVILLLAFGLALLLRALIERAAEEKLLNKALEDVLSRLDSYAQEGPGLDWARNATRATLLLWGFLLVHCGLLLMVVSAALVWLLKLPARLIWRRRSPSHSQAR